MGMGLLPADRRAHHLHPTVPLKGYKKDFRAGPSSVVNLHREAQDGIAVAPPPVYR